MVNAAIASDAIPTNKIFFISLSVDRLFESNEMVSISFPPQRCPDGWEDRHHSDASSITLPS
jgi:hypothetical protein